MHGAGIKTGPTTAPCGAVAHGTKVALLLVALARSVISAKVVSYYLIYLSVYFFSHFLGGVNCTSTSKELGITAVCNIRFKIMHFRLR